LRGIRIVGRTSGGAGTPASSSVENAMNRQNGARERREMRE
jgi:hypothetical protein